MEIAVDNKKKIFIFILVVTMALVCLHCGRLLRDLEKVREGVRGKTTYLGAPDSLADIDRFSVSEMPPPILEESFLMNNIIDYLPFCCPTFSINRSFKSE
jgi:hypothetical protein